MSTRETIENLVISITSKVTFGGAITSFISSLGNINWMTYISGILAVTSLVINILFQIRRDQRESADHRHKLKSRDIEREAKIVLMNKGVNPNSRFDD